MTRARPHGWKTLSSEIKYRNAWISVREDAVVYPNGLRGIYGVVDKGPGVCVVPVAGDGAVYLLRQYRYTVDAEVWELPAGAIQPGESGREAARRELAEETGLSARRLRRLGRFYTAPGHETAEIIVYLAAVLGAGPGRARRQHDESILALRKFPAAAVRRMIREDRINCGIALASLNCWFQSGAARRPGAGR